MYFLRKHFYVEFVCDKIHFPDVFFCTFHVLCAVVEKIRLLCSVENVFNNFIDVRVRLAEEARHAIVAVEESRFSAMMAPSFCALCMSLCGRHASLQASADFFVAPRLVESVQRLLVDLV